MMVSPTSTAAAREQRQASSDLAAGRLEHAPTSGLSLRGGELSRDPADN
jgi:hypothetical protein